MLGTLHWSEVYAVQKITGCWRADVYSMSTVYTSCCSICCTTDYRQLMSSSVLGLLSTLHLTHGYSTPWLQVTQCVEYSSLGELNSTQWRSHLSKNCGVIVNSKFILKSLALSSSHPCVFAPVFLTFVPLYFSFFLCMCITRVTENIHIVYFLSDICVFARVFPPFTT